jgi:hypothetical protein
MPEHEDFSAKAWADGFLIDFILKKVTDCWLRRWVICTANIAADKVLFRVASRAYIDYGLMPAQSAAALTGGSTAVMLGNLTSLAFGLLWLWCLLSV